MINSVRNAVLSVLNKNNYGYISPSDFNLFAANAQMEIYEEYFSSYNKVINAENARASGTEYADIEQPIAETMETFLRSAYLSKIAANRFSMPSLTTTGDEAYYILDIQCRPVILRQGFNTTVSTGLLVDTFANFIQLGISAGDIVVNTVTNNSATVTAVLSATTLGLDTNIFLTTGQGYVIVSQATVAQAEKVYNSKITLLNNSNLTAPNNLYPAYVIIGNEVQMYPKTIQYKGQVEAKYFRFPKVPKWTYITLSNGEPVFDQSQSDYQDFELPPEEEYKLVMKILQYAGMSIREAEAVQFGMAQEQHEQPSFSQQQ